MSVIKHTRRNVNRDITLCAKSAYLNSEPDNTSFKRRDKLFSTQKHAVTKIKQNHGRLLCEFYFSLRKEKQMC